MNKITLSGIKNMSTTEIKNLKEDDKDAVRDIMLTLENNSSTYNQVVNYVKSLQKKQAKGNYNYSLAVKGMLNISDKNIKDVYMNNFCNKNSKISNLVNINDRVIIARDLLENYINDRFN